MMLNKKITKSVVSLVLCAMMTFSATSVFASVLGSSRINGYTKQIGEGVFFTHNLFFSDQENVGQQSENYITYEPNSSVMPSITFGNALFGAETLSTETNRLEALNLDVLGGANADFFSFQTGVPMSNAIIDGKIVTKDSEGQDAIGIMEDGTAFMSYITFNSILTREDGSKINIHNINKYRQPYTIYLMTDEFSDTTQNTTKGYDVVLGSIQGEIRLGTTMTAVVESVELNSSAVKIPKGKMIITVDENAPAELVGQISALKTGEKISIDFSVDGDARWNDVRVGMGSIGGKLLTNGKINPNLEAGAAPRTAIGITEDGALILYTIDGRQQGHSYGVQLKTLALRMQELGCVEALNLDGGGSTAITAQMPGDNFSVLQNKPSGGSERNVSTYFYFINKAYPTGEPAYLHLYPNITGVLTGSELQLSVKATDHGFYPVKLPAGVNFSVEEGKNSTVTSDGVFTAKDDGVVTVYANYGEAKGALEVVCLETPTSIHVMNKKNGELVEALVLDPGEKVALTADAYGGYNKLTETDDSFRWEVDSNIGSFDGEHTFVASENYGAKGYIRVSAGERTVTIPVELNSATGTASDPDSYPVIEMEFENGTLLGKISNKYAIPTEEKDVTVRADGKTQAVEYDMENGEFKVKLDSDVQKITVCATNTSGYTAFKTMAVGDESFDAPFADTKGHWAENILGYMYSKKIISGDPTDGTLKFNPQKQMTRSEFAVMMVNYLGVDSAEYENVRLPYSDADKIPAWALNSFKALYNLGILTGRYVSDTETVADPTSSISRAEAATIVARTLPEGFFRTPIKATDKKDIAPWAEDGFSVMLNIGAMKGYEDGSLKPLNPLTKAEAAKILYSAM